MIIETSWSGSRCHCPCLLCFSSKLSLLDALQFFICISSWHFGHVFCFSGIPWITFETDFLFWIIANLLIPYGWFSGERRFIYPDFESVHESLVGYMIFLHILPTALICIEVFTFLCICRLILSFYIVPALIEITWSPVHPIRVWYDIHRCWWFYL